MNKSLIIGIAVIVVLVGGTGIYWSFMQSNNDTVMIEKTAIEKEVMTKEEAVKKDENVMTKAGSYEVYSPEKIVMASTTHDVVLFFHARWCPTCRAVDTDIKAHLKDIPETLSILDVDYDNSTELKKKYGVTYQHTFVQVDERGKLIKKWSGSPTLSALVAEVK